MNEGQYFTDPERSRTPIQSDDLPPPTQLPLPLPLSSPLRPLAHQPSSSPLRRSQSPVRLSQIPSNVISPSSQLSSSSQASLPRATVKQKLMVLDWFHFHSATQQQTVEHFRYNRDFGITKSSFNRWVKDERKLRSAIKLLSVEERSSSRKVQFQKFNGADKCLEKWVEQQLFEDEGFSEKSMVDKWVLFNRLYDPSAVVQGQEKVKSNGWIHSFKSKMKPRREQIQSFVQDQIAHYSESPEQECKRLRDELHGFLDKDIFHMDEFGVSDRIVPVGTQFTRFTIGLCINSDGSEVLDSLIISHSSELEGTILSRVGLTPEIFWEHLSSINEKLGQRKIVLLLDRLYDHVTANDLSNVKIVWLEKIQSPLELGIRWFKLELKTALIKHMLVEWTNHRRVKIRTDLEVLLVVQQVIDKLPSQFAIIQNSWAATGIMKPEGVVNWSHFRDQENVFGTLLRVAQEKKLVHTFSLGFKELLSPLDEKIVNRHFSDQDIVAYVKILEKNTESIKTNNADQKKTSDLALAQHVDVQQLKKVDLMIHRELRRFFENDTTVARFPRSSTAFLRFWNEYVSESMNAWVEEQ